MRFAYACSWRGLVGVALAVALAGCGRTGILDDNGCPPDNPNCTLLGDGPIGVGPDGGGTGSDGGGAMHDGFDFFGDGFFSQGDGFVGDGGLDANLDQGDGLGTGDGALGGDGFGTDGGGTLVDMVRPPVDLSGCVNPQLDCTLAGNQSTTACIDKRHENCSNGVDDDGNGLVDCKDPACFGERGCFQRGTEVCNNGLDDDDNGLVDCADPSCAASSVCMPHMGKEVCDDNVDNNGDGLVDCADPQCVSFAACVAAACTYDVDFGAIPPHGGLVSRTLSTVGTCQSFETCAAPGGSARVGRVVLGGTTDLRLDVAQQAGAAHVVSLFRAGVDQSCDLNPVSCYQLGEMKAGTHTFAGLGAGTYWLVVQSYPGTAGNVLVTLSTGGLPSGDMGVSGGDMDMSATDMAGVDLAGDMNTGIADGGVPTCVPTGPEVCNNGVDDDCNGLTDCQDTACIHDPNCAAKECFPDANVGALVVNGPYKEVKFDTATSSNRYHPTCAGNSAGNDYVIHLQLQEPAGILVQWTQTGDHVFGLYAAPDAGQPCDAIQQSCYNPDGAPGGSVAWQVRPPGDYLFILKTVNGKEGVMDLKISAFANRSVEICNNGIDDDGNGLTDCADPACFGVGNCKVPLCMPDIDLGDFSWGTQKMVTVDTSTGNDFYQAKCAEGSGKEKVIRVSLDEPMALGFSCTQTGDNVLQLDAQVNPLDLCDANRLVCGDPKTLPFGCNYAVPNLQPGKYNIIVQAFTGGSEGVVNLTLTGIQENSPIDCSVAGNCSDLRCVTSPFCQVYACRADVRLGLLPYTGTPTSTVVQTSNKEDNNTQTPCVSAAGGKDAVVDFETPAQGDLTIEWAQVGNHDFALYSDSNDGLACEDNPIVDCHSSGGAATGSYTLKMLPAHKYHFIVDADKPGAEGGVVLQFSGLPN